MPYFILLFNVLAAAALEYDSYLIFLELHFYSLYFLAFSLEVLDALGYV